MSTPAPDGRKAPSARFAPTDRPAPSTRLAPTDRPTSTARGWLTVAYLVLAVAGLIGTWYFNLQSGDVEGGYLNGWVANSASTSAAVDLAVAYIAASIFMIVEGRRVGVRAAWLYVVLALPTAFAFTFPLFLAQRERVRSQSRDRTA